MDDMTQNVWIQRIKELAGRPENEGDDLLGMVTCIAEMLNDQHQEHMLVLEEIRDALER